MSAYFITIGLPHDFALPPVVISGPEVSPSEQRARFKSEFMPQRSHKTFRLVHLLDSRRGISKRKSFISPAEVKRREKALAAEAKAQATSPEGSVSGDVGSPPAAQADDTDPPL